MLLEKHAVVDDDGDGDHENDCDNVHDDDIGAYGYLIADDVMIHLSSLTMMTSRKIS